MAVEPGAKMLVHPKRVTRHLVRVGKAIGMTVIGALAACPHGPRC